MCVFPYLQEHVQFVFHLWPNVCVHRVQSKAAAMSKIWHFISCEKLCALQSKSKYYTQDFESSLKACEGLAALKPFPLFRLTHSTKLWGLIPNKLMEGWNYPLKQQEGGEGTPLKGSKLGALWRTELISADHTWLSVQSIIKLEIHTWNWRGK